MADPISIISLVAVAAHTGNKTKQLVESIKGAPDSVSRLSGDLEAIKTPLQDLRKLSEDVHGFDAATRTEITRSLKPAVSSCRQTVSEFDNIIGPYVRSDGTVHRTTWKRMSFGFKEHKVLILRGQLEACKSSLHLAALRASM